MKNSLTLVVKAMGMAVVGVLIPLSSQAFTINSSTAINSTFTVDYLRKADSSINQDLKASIMFTLMSYNSATGSIGLQLEVSNTSDLLGNSVGLNKFAFGTDPNAISASLSQIDTALDIDKFISATWENPNTNQSEISPELTLGNTLILDVESDTGNGYANGTLNEGKLDVFNLTVGFTSPLPNAGVTFNPFSAKFQTAKGSFEFAGVERCTTNCGGGGGPGGDPLPEPDVVALMGIGLLGMTLARRRKFA